MVLKTIVGNRLLSHVLRHNQKSDKVDWRVLVVDKVSIKILSTCIKMHQLNKEGITLVETLEKKREPIPSMEAIYFLTPSEESINLLMEDFSKTVTQYKAAHVYFTEVIPDHLFKTLSKSAAGKAVKSLVEVNISFTPYESKVYSLELQPNMSLAYSPDRTGTLERMAEQLATLCCTLGEFPSIRYRAECGVNKHLAEILLGRLTAYKKDETSMGEGPEKAKSQLIILDRGFDITTPLLHELTFQAMAYDLLTIQNDVYKYNTGINTSKEVILDENDDLWEELRHQHIAMVNQIVSKKMKKFNEEKKIPNASENDSKDSIRDLAMLIKKMPQYQADLAKFSTHLHMAEECMKTYQGYVDKLCKVEQDLAMGKDADGERIKDQMRNIVPVLLATNVTINDKIRIILLYILSKQGISEENLSKLVQHAQIPQEKIEVIKNMSKLGVNIVNDGSKSQTWKANRKDRITENTYQMSRWTPVLKDLVEDAIEGKLDSTHFPYLSDQRGQAKSQAPASNRYGRWHKDKSDQTSRNSRVIVFIIGGSTFSEARCGYEISRDKQNSWEVIVGGDTHILTPEQFLSNVQNFGM